MDFLGQVKVPVKNVTFWGFRGSRVVSGLPIGGGLDCNLNVFTPGLIDLWGSKNDDFSINCHF